MNQIFCEVCERKIIQDQTGEPFLLFKQKPICYDCYINLIPAIYEMSGAGDGGLIHFIFQKLLVSSHNRKQRIQIPRYKIILNKLLNKYNFKCIYCKSTENLTIDHILPICRGGTHDFSNLQILCKSCNSKKGSKIVGDN